MLRLLLPPSVGVARAQARGELLEASLATDLGEQVVVEVASDYGAIADAVRDATAELVWAPAAVVAEIEDDEARASDRVGSVRGQRRSTPVMIFKTVREGRSVYHSALIARLDAHLGLERLVGKRAAWVDALSIGGFLLAKQHLEERGIALASTFTSQEFVGTHPAALEAVLEGRADVAAISVPGTDPEHVTQALSLHAGRVGALRLDAIAITRSAPNDALLLTRAMDQSQVDALVARVFPTTGRGKSSALCLAMEAEGFERAQPGEYAKLLPLFR